MILSFTLLQRCHEGAADTKDGLMSKLIQVRTVRAFELQAKLLRENGKLPLKVFPTFKVLEFPKKFAA